MSHDRWSREDDWGLPFSWAIRGAVWRVVVSVLAPVLWLILTLLFFAFWAHGLTLAQDIVVGFVSVLALFAALVVVWVSFGIQAYHRWAHS